MIVSSVGSWTVHEGTVITPEGATQVTVIKDGVTELVTEADPAQLMIALMTHLGVESISGESDS